MFFGGICLKIFFFFFFIVGGGGVGIALTGCIYLFVGNILFVIY